MGIDRDTGFELRTFNEALGSMGAAMARDAPPSLQTLVSALLRAKLEVALAGLDGAGKTTLARTLQRPDQPPGPPPPPTVGLVVHQARQRGIDLSLWDLGGQHRFRCDWAGHARGCRALLFVVDASDAARLPEACLALHRLLEDPKVRHLPLLVLANKTDALPPATREQEVGPSRTRAQREVSKAGERPAHRASSSCRQESRGSAAWSGLVDALQLGSVRCPRWSILGTSGTQQTNLPLLVRWLVLQAHAADAAADADDDAAVDPPGVFSSRWWWPWGRKSTYRGSRYGRLATALLGDADECGDLGADGDGAAAGSSARERGHIAETLLAHATTAYTAL